MKRIQIVVLAFLFAISIDLAKSVYTQGSAYVAGQVLTSSSAALPGACTPGDLITNPALFNFYICGPTTNIFSAVHRTLCSKIGSSDTLVASTISTNETAFATTCTIPANFIVANRTIRATIGIEETTSGSPPTVLYKYKAGSTIIASTGAVPPAANDASKGFALVYITQGTAAAGASVNTETMFLSALINGTVVSNSTAQPIAVATNADAVMTLTLTYSANTAGNSVTLRQFILEALN